MHVIASRPLASTHHRRHFHRGGSLIEVLVSIVISSIALLALAGVNASALRYTKMSQYRATATLLASDLGERMRANKGLAAAGGVAATGFFAGVYDYSSTDFAGQATAATLPAQLCNTAASTCSPQQIAELDLAQWRLLVRTQLPEGSIFISREAGQTAADVWVAWRDPAVANNDEAPALAKECPDSLNLEDDRSIRCSFFRINL
ncbi:MAG: type IV pilus modification protein PilV [Pseudomonadota bacterium]|uniref:type IV pilus modification protein PilV n=1 Tax=Polaromonas sp. TaxID=1869339 RepID=UPI0018199A67|nr:type IV pilus modification protein PilV [Polaromonas sp.]MBA3593846.1 type IV pilus modification protein PilV [Polaromonas sp.]MDQ3272429.1 type IV pilus modification protein PilV [Pseudomonadota bacterium]